MLKISIPTPCHEDWNAMMPNAQGKHCNTCAKTVVDFTKMSDDEVKIFLLNRKDEKLCGRFRNEQLNRITIDLPNNIFYLQIPLWKKYLAAILVAFSSTLFSCDIHLQGKPIFKEDKKVLLGGAIADFKKTDTAYIDTVFSVKEISTTGVPQIESPLEIQGDINIEPVQPIENIVGVIAIPKVDTPKVEEQYNKVGEIIFNEKIDSVPKKLKDTANCDKKIYY